MIDCNNVLVLAPHTDDGELGLGGTIHKLISMGKNVYYAAFSTAGQSVPEGFSRDVLKYEVKRATARLGIKPENLFIYDFEVRKLNYYRQEILEELINLRKKYRFDLIFIPSLHDIHQDHSTLAQEGVRAFKNATVLGYELIWNNLSFNTQCFFQLSKENIEAKISALSEYRSQGLRNYLSPDFIYSLAKTRGVQIGSDYAESFEVIRLFL